MEEEQKNHICNNLPRLIENTSCDVMFVAKLRAWNVLSISDVAALDSITNELKKTQKCYDIIVTRADSYDLLCKALLETKQTGTLEILNELSGAHTPLPELAARNRKRIRFDVRAPVQNFTGRVEELLSLHENLTQTQPATAIVSGLGGIGKTELCRRYIDRYSQEYDGNVVWIVAEKTESMHNSFKLLAKSHLHISLKDLDGEEKDITTVVDEVYRFFAEKKCLFVFDNAVSSDSEHFDTFMPTRVETKPSIIITSRDRDWELPTAYKLDVGEMTDIDAIEFVKKGLNFKDDSENDVIRMLITRLQRFPLALQQSISYIKQQITVRQYKISSYLEKFEQNSEKLLQSKIPPLMANRYTKTTFTTWKITTEVIAEDADHGQLAICMLNILSYLEPDKIPADLLVGLQEVEEDDVFTALALLAKYSMINSQTDQRTYSVHRLVQEVTRIDTRHNKTEVEVIRKCLSLFKSNTEGEIGEVSIAHATSAFEYASNHSCLVMEFRCFPLKIVDQLQKSTQDNKARVYCHKILEVFSRYLHGTAHVDIISVEFKLALLEQRHDIRLSMLKQVLKRYESLGLKQIKEYNFEILSVKSKICKGFLALLKVQEGFEMLINIFRKHFASESVFEIKKPGVNCKYEEFVMFTILCDMLNFVKSSGHENWNVIFKHAFQTAKAFVTIKEHVIAIWLLTFLEGFGQQMNAGVNIQFKILSEHARIYEEDCDESYLTGTQKIFEKAEPLFESNIKLTWTGVKHGKRLAKQNRLLEAVNVMKTVYECRQKVLGPLHSDTNEALHLLGSYKQMAGECEGAAKMIQQAQENLSKQIGNKHPIALGAKWDMVHVLDSSAKYMEKLNLLLEIYENYEEVAVPLKIETLKVLAEMAHTLSKMKAYWSTDILCKELENTYPDELHGHESELDYLKLEMKGIRGFCCFQFYDEDDILADFHILRYESRRRDSFFRSSAWKTNVPFIKPEDCAEAGFFYLGDVAEVQCIFCGEIIKEWNIGQTPRIEHKNRAPWCPYIMGVPVGNISIASENAAKKPSKQLNQFLYMLLNDDDSEDNDYTSKWLRPITSENHEVYPEVFITNSGGTNFADMQSRLETYKNWPSSSEIDPKILAAAGFRYIGRNEDIACFSCGAGFIKKWRINDNPWAEHANAFPNCRYMKTAYFEIVQHRSSMFQS